jgi:hypothetical protein
MQENLKKLSDLLLSEHTNWQDKFLLLQDMHRLFVKLGALDAYIADKKTDDIWLKNGCAVSPKSAAMCMFEINRTEKFVKGLIAAIEDLLAASANRPVQVLDAGAGPYALFSLLAALYFTPAQVQFTIIDIHPQNIQSIHNLVNRLQMQPYFSSIALDDAIHYQWPKDKKLDIIITETMKNGLNKETQVAITLNLNRQLSKNGIFIPEKITLHLKQIDKQKQNAYLFNPENSGQLPFASFEKELCEIMCLHKNSRVADIEKDPLSVATIPDDFLLDKETLSIYTTITVYNHLQLERNDTSISFPIRISYPSKKTIFPQNKVVFRYHNQDFPGIRYEVFGKEVTNQVILS